MTLKERAEQRQQVLVDFHESGLTQAAFCKARGVELSTLQYRLKREGEETAGKKPPGFVELPKPKSTPATAGSPIRVRIGERIIVEIDPPVAAEQLAEIFKAAGAVGWRRSSPGLRCTCVRDAPICDKQRTDFRFSPKNTWNLIQ